eukprot:429377-Rhodomonas_salina.1
MEMAVINPSFIMGPTAPEVARRASKPSFFALAPPPSPPAFRRCDLKRARCARLCVASVSVGHNLLWVSIFCVGGPKSSARTLRNSD